MSIGIGHKHTSASNFTVLPNEILRPVGLSMEAQMMLLWMLSNRDGFQYSHSRIITYWQITKHKAQKIITELQENNHLYIRRGQGADVQWHYFDDPEDCFKFKQKSHHPEIQECDQVHHPVSQDPDRQDVLRSTKDLTRTNNTTLHAREKTEPVDNLLDTVMQIPVTELTLDGQFKQEADRLPANDRKFEFENFQLEYSDNQRRTQAQWFKRWRTWVKNYRPSRPDRKPAKPVTKSEQLTPEQEAKRVRDMQPMFLEMLTPEGIEFRKEIGKELPPKLRDLTPEQKSRIVEKKWLDLLSKENE